MSLIQLFLKLNSTRAFKSAGFAVLTVCLLVPSSLFGESLARSISLEANDSEQVIRIPVGVQLKVQNNYPQELYQTSVIGSSNKRLLNIETFQPGQSFDLEFTKKGPYSVCYSLESGEDSEKSICLQINVVPLQTA